MSDNQYIDIVVLDEDTGMKATFKVHKRAPLSTITDMLLTSKKLTHRGYTLNERLSVSHYNIRAGDTLLLV